MRNIIIVIITVLMITSCDNDEIYFINNIKVFSEYQGKKELEGEVKAFEKEIRNKLDSIEIKLIETKSKQGKQAPPYLRLAREYTELEYYMKESIQQKDAAYTEQIWTQINTYVKEYGKQQGYKLIIGGNGQGTVMYGDEKIDLTEDVIKYVNNKYQGY